MTMDLRAESIALHQRNRGKIATKILTPIKNRHDLSLAYTPGVGEISKIIAEDKSQVSKLTIKQHTVAIVTDGSAVLGLGDIGPEAALPVMEGKAALFKTFADLDAFPVCLATKDPGEIVKTVRYLEPVFGAVNLEDISAPRCFAIEEQLQDLGIPVMHDDQHGTAVVVLAGLINAAKVVGKKLSGLEVVISGAGAAGQAIAKILLPKVKEVVILDSRGIIFEGRADLDDYKQRLAKQTNRSRKQGGLMEALTGSDVFIGVSKAGLLNPEWIRLMAQDPIIFALANPTPEIMPDLALKFGARVVATGRSDFANQINNSLAFPGIFKGALLAGAKKITEPMKQAASLAIAKMVPYPSPKLIIPGPFEKNLAESVAKAVVKAAKE